MAAPAHPPSERVIARHVSLAALALLLSLSLTGCAPRASSNTPPILLFNGAGTSANDVAAVEAVLSASHLDYATVNSSELNGMSTSQLMAYHLMIIPGGNFIAIGDGLTSSATANIHDAVQGGLNYLGICAGAFLAGQGPYKSLNLTSGARFDFYADESRGIRKAAVPIAAIGTPTLEQYWEDGPQLSGWGDVVGKYPDGTPAIVEGTSGKGWVILTGVHPEAPANWRSGMTFTTPASVAHAYAATLIDAALHGTRLPHY
jgi:Biotin-protein ligase, N terminal